MTTTFLFSLVLLSTPFGFPTSLAGPEGESILTFAQIQATIWPALPQGQTTSALLAAPCTVGGSDHEAESTGLWPRRGKAAFGPMGTWGHSVPSLPSLLLQTRTFTLCSLVGPTWARSPLIDSYGDTTATALCGSRGPPDGLFLIPTAAPSPHRAPSVSLSPWTCTGAPLPLGGNFLLS